MQDQDGSEIDETSVTVTGTESADSGAVLRFAATPAIPVELSVDPSATSDNTNSSRSSALSSTVVINGSQSSQIVNSTTPNPMQFGLGLQRVDPTNDEDQTYIG